MYLKEIGLYAQFGNHHGIKIQHDFSGRPLPLILMYTCALNTYLSGAIYLVEQIIRYGISQTKGKFLYFNTPISKFWGFI